MLHNVANVSGKLNIFFISALRYTYGCWRHIKGRR